MEGSEIAARRICVVTTSRADYGLLCGLMHAMDEDDDLELQVVVTGMHLTPEFGLTYRDIEDDGFTIARRVELPLPADTDAAVSKAIGMGLVAFADVMDQLRPDILVVLGDRYELLSPVIAAFVARIPIAHIHGGETSQGALDEGVRHAITKMAALHFPATKAYAQRIVQMGEDPETVFAYGAPGLDALHSMHLLTKGELASLLGRELESPMAIVTYHPVTLERDTAGGQIDNLLSALLLEGVGAVFTKSNADAQGTLINERIAAFCSEHPSRYGLYDNLGRTAYLSCLRHLELVIGNSSSGLIEAPSFHLPTVNIGDRQLGRVKAESVLDVGYSTGEIAAGIRQALTPGWRASLKDVENPYAGPLDGSVSVRIKDQLKRAELGERLLKKRFHDAAGPVAGSTAPHEAVR
jgi:UDP-hydrolysing UDP-N-acetyl-D-glucosamine 2-epimerase